MTSICVGFFTPVHSLDPHHAQDYVGGQIIEQLYETPYRQRSADQPVEPVVFDGMLQRERAPGGSTRCTGHIRDGLKFSDGSPVTAQDVVDSLQLAQPIISRARVTAIGDTVEFLLPEDDPRFEVALSRRWCSIVGRRGDQLLGTGPYAVKPGWTPDHIRIERNVHARHVPKIDEVEFRVFPVSDAGTPDDLLAAIRDGTVDFTTALSRDDVGALSGVRKVFNPGSSTAILFFNTEHAALQNVDVRHSMCEAIDRSAVAALSYENPHAFAARSVLPPTMWRLSDGIRHDPTTARERLISSGVLPARPLRMLLMWGPRPYLPHPFRTADELTRQLGTIGIEVEHVRTQDSLEHREITEKGGYDLALAGWMADTPDPHDFLAAMFRSDSIPVPGRPNASANNMSRYVSGEMNDALEAYRKTATEGSLRAVMDILTRDAPICPLFYGPSIVVHAWRLKNVELSPIGMPLLADAELD